MDLTARRGDSYMIKDEKREEAFTQTNPSIFPNLAPSSSSPSATTPFGWRLGQSEISAAAGGGGADGCSEDENFLSEKEHMFDKVVTPSDVGKLNRLVIPKQYAEKYFPLDPAANKGMLLSFEDRTGKSWRFRYSYWNSSQSYVITKGWSRFVKDKRLDAGDVVSFGRGLGEPGCDHFYIDWKRRPNNHDQTRLPLARPMGPWIGGNGGGWHFNIPLVAAYDHHRRRQVFGGYGSPPCGGGQFLYLTSSMAGPPQLGLPYFGGSAAPMVLDLQPLARNKAAAAAKRVRLFGVNLDCSEPEGNARLPSAASAIASWSPESCTIPFLPFAYGGIEASSSATAPLTSKHNLTLDLEL